MPIGAESPLYTIEGYRCSLVAPGAYDSFRFDFCATRRLTDNNTQKFVKKLRLSLYDAAETDLPLRMRLKVRLKEPHGSVNPEGFRYETWLFRHGFDATGSVRDWQTAPDITCGLACHYHQWRDQVAQYLARAYGRIEAYPMMEALLLGERRFLQTQDWAVFQATGTSHLIAISGLHIGLVGLFSGWLTSQLLLRVSRRLIGPRGRRRGVVVASLLACLTYALLAGFTVPTQRALVMAIVAATVYLRSRLSGYWTAWLTALGCVLLLDPFAPLDGGFWLSFGAVACLILLFSGRLRSPGSLLTLVQAQAGITAGLLPVLAGLGIPTAALGWFVNLLAIPLMSFVLLPSLLVLAPLGMMSDALLRFIAPVLDMLLSGFLAGLAWFADLAPGGLQLDTTVAVIVAASVMVCLLPVGNTSRLILIGVSILGLGGQFLLKPENTTVDYPELWVWDVGQGLSVLFRQADQALLYDTGPGSPSGYSAVNSVIRPNLLGLGVRRIDALVISHGDADHASGLASLFNHVVVGRFLSGEPERLIERGFEQHQADACVSGARQLLDGVTVERWQTSDAAPGNSRSCVLRIMTEQAEIILPGDITAEEEKAWLAEHDVSPDRLRVVVAPHHGSRTSSSDAWVSTLQPDAVVFSAGYRHPYGHPATEVQARYAAVGADLYNTATYGAIRIELVDDALRVTPARAAAPFWIAPMPGVRLQGEVERVWRQAPPVLK